MSISAPRTRPASKVRRYLREFLNDPRVLDYPALGRCLLLNLVILPFRPRKSAEAYEKIWTAEGSPLLLHTRHSANAAGRCRKADKVEYAMRYGSLHPRAN